MSCFWQKYPASNFLPDLWQSNHQYKTFKDAARLQVGKLINLPMSMYEDQSGRKMIVIVNDKLQVGHSLVACKMQILIEYDKVTEVQDMYISHLPIY